MPVCYVPVCYGVDKKKRPLFHNKGFRIPSVHRGRIAALMHRYVDSLSESGPACEIMVLFIINIIAKLSMP